MTSRPTPFSNPQIHTGAEGAGATRCCSPGLHPPIEAAEEGAQMSRHRDGDLPVAPASLPDDDDMLREILIRLPPQPSSLPRVSAVCRRWRRIVADPKFQRQFRVHHRKPPLLGVFQSSDLGVLFIPMLDPPDRIPPQRFDLKRYSGNARAGLLDCRHGRVLIKNSLRNDFVVCDPIIGEHCSLAVPPDFNFAFLNGTVLCAAGDLGHVHGGCHSSPFKVILVSIWTKDKRNIACVYSSEIGIWGNLILTEAPNVFPTGTSVLVGNCLYWLSIENDILHFDLDGASLTMIRGPDVGNLYVQCQIIQAEEGAVGYAILSYPCLQMWQRNINGHSVATWVPWKTIEMDSILRLPGDMGGKKIIRGYDEDVDAIFLDVKGSVYMVQMKSMQSSKVDKTIGPYRYRPFKSFYAPVIRECDEADMKHDP